jgi:hypothetical protein
MGNTVWKIVKWVGNCILEVVDWWLSYKDKVDRNTYNFIEENKYYIIQADNQVAVCETVAINEEKNQLEEISAQRYKNLSSNDRYNIDSLLARRDY